MTGRPSAPPRFLFLALLLSVSVARAEVISVPLENFSVELPVGWEVNSPAPAGTALVAKSPKGDRHLVIQSSTHSGDKAPNAAVTVAEVRGMLERAEEKTEKGVERKYPSIKENRENTFDLTWFTVSAIHPGTGNSLLTWVTTVDAKNYILVAEGLKVDVAKDPEVLSILRSFHILAAPKQEGIKLAHVGGWGPLLRKAAWPLSFVGVLFLFGVVMFFVAAFSRETRA